MFIYVHLCILYVPYCRLYSQPCLHLDNGEGSPTFGHANAIFSVFVYRIRNQFPKEWIIMIQISIA